MTLTLDNIRQIVEVTYAEDLEFVDLVGLAELDPAMAFRGKVMRGTDFRGQDLAGFDFTGAVLIDCDFTDAKLKGCTLPDADLSQAKGLTPEMLAAAITARRAERPCDEFWVSGRAPPWAEDWDRDQYGPWVTFRVPQTQVKQRMRWIPPGTFTMGSPLNERLRYNNEEPQREVTLEHGFWMFDTVCTEALWSVVMGEPQRSLGPTFPITYVSWDDAQNFVRRLNGFMPGLGLRLPSEARWEYACRAGTKTAYSFGVTIGHDQVCFRCQTPVRAGALQPNRWGMHEMHGNILEWCEDTWHCDYSGAPVDDRPWIDRGVTMHVIRGGSWRSAQRNVRSAARRFRPLMHRLGHLGFRCTRGYVLTEAEKAEPVYFRPDR
jgi:formylglycine-generating enzyme required for sulfatase activity